MEEKFYLYINNGCIDGCGQAFCDEVECMEITANEFEKFEQSPECFDFVDGKLVFNEAKAEQKNINDALLQAKEERAEAVSKITVEVDGLVFDGDRTAQANITEAIIASREAFGDVEYKNYQTPWVLADNTVTTVTIGQLAQALILAKQILTPIWIKPYE